MSNPLYLANVREKFQKFLAAGKTVDHNAFSDSLCMGSSLIKANMPARPCNQTAVVQYRSSRVQRHTRHIIGHFGDNLHSQSLDGAKKPVFLTNQLADSSTTIDNRIYNSRLNTSYQLNCADENVINFHGTKNGRHVESRAAIGRRNTPHHSYTSGSKRSSCLRT